MFIKVPTLANLKDYCDLFFLDPLTHLIYCSFSHSWRKLTWPKDSVHSKEKCITSGEVETWILGIFSLSPAFLLPGPLLKLWASGATHLNWREDFNYVKVGVDQMASKHITSQSSDFLFCHQEISCRFVTPLKVVHLLLKSLFILSFWIISIYKSHRA